MNLVERLAAAEAAAADFQARVQTLSDVVEASQTQLATIEAALGLSGTPSSPFGE